MHSAIAKIMSKSQQLGWVILLLAVCLPLHAGAGEMIHTHTVYMTQEQADAYYRDHDRVEAAPVDEDADPEEEPTPLKQVHGRPPPPRTETRSIFDPISAALRLIVNGQTYESSNRTTIPTMDQAYSASCGGPISGRSLCRSWPTLKRSFEGAARALGFPAPALVCLMKAESNFISGQTSGAGARGLTQFMPGTAALYANLMRRSPTYQQAWEKYRQSGGTLRPVSTFTAANIRSNQSGMADIQIFATAMYFRDSLKGTEPYFQRSLGNAREPNRGYFRHMMHYLLISYNAGGVAGQSFLRRPNYGRLPYETQGYIRKFDSCMARAAQFRGQR